jgi:hypothetical protein
MILNSFSGKKVFFILNQNKQLVKRRLMEPYKIVTEQVCFCLSKLILHLCVCININ